MTVNTAKQFLGTPTLNVLIPKYLKVTDLLLQCS